MISSFTRGTVSALLLSLAAAAGLQAQAPAISATKTDNLPAGTKVNPGATVTYTNTVTNSGTANATGVNFADPDVNGATVQMSTLKVSPLAFDDVYTGIIASGVSIDTSVGTQFSATSNDYVGVFNNAAGVLSIVSFDATSANGGAVSMTTSGANVGKFTYTSAAGFTGADTFTYTVSNTGFTSTGTVRLTVSGPGMWFVSSSGNDTTGKGTLAAPFQTLTKVATVDANTSQRIFMFTGAYTAGITLEANEQILGQGVVGASFDAAVLGIAPGSDSAPRPSINGTRPTITAAAGNVINLADGNVLRGVTINSTVSGFGVAGTATPSLQLGSTVAGTPAADTVVNSTGSSTGCLSLTGSATGTVTVTAQLTATVGRSVNITGRTGGTTSIIGKVTDNGTGISLASNTGATFNFRCLVLNTGANVAFAATGSSTVNITNGFSDSIDNDGDGSTDEADEANTLATTTGTAVNLNGVTIGAGGMTFRSVNSNGAANGIKLVNVACGSPGLSVVGDNTGFANGSGGSISNTTGASLGDAPVHALTCSGTISLKSMNMSLNTNCYSGMLVDNNAGGTLAVNVTGCTFIGVTSSIVQNKSLLQFEAGGSANVTANVQNSYFSSNRTYGCFATGAGTSLVNVTVNQCGFGTNVNTGAPVNQPGTTITNPPPFSLGVTNGSSAQVDYSITNNTFWGADGLQGAIYAVTISGASTTATSRLDGSFNGNKIGRTGVTGSGAANGAGGLGLLPGTQGAFRATVLNNDIRQVNAVGINFFNSAGPGANSTATLKVKGNTIAEPDTTGSPLFMRAIVVTPGNSGGANNPWIAEIGDTTGSVPANRNTISDGGTAPSGTNTWQPLNYIRVTNNNNTAALTLPGLSPTSGASAAQVNAFVQGANTLPASSINSTVGTAGINGGAALPLLFAPRALETFDSSTPPDSVSSAIAWTEAARERHLAEPTLPDMASAPEAPAPLTQEQLDTLITASRERWVATGLSDEQLAALDKVTFELADLPGWHLGETAGMTLRIDRDAGGNGWFIDTTPMDDGEFAVEGSRLMSASATSSTRNRVDLLTTILHEMGHGIGLCDTYSNLQRNSVMYGFLTTGERRLPAKGQAIGAKPHEHSGSHFLTGAINIGVLPPGKSVTIIYDVVVNNPPTTSTLSSQATVSGDNFANVLTDDRGQPLIVAPPTPAETNLPGAADPTVTLIELPDVNLAISPASVLEDGSGTLTYTFTREGATAAPLTVSFAATGTAAATSDYGIASGTGTASFTPGTGLGTLTIPIGQSSATLTLSPTDDLSVETDETAILTVVTGTAYDVGVVTPAATGSILNDDTDVSVAVAPSSVSEDGATNLVYTFTRTGVTAGALTVNFNVTGSATTADSDYTQTGAATFSDTAGTVTFAAASSTATVTLDPTADNTPEADEGVTFTLVSGAGYTAISPTAAIGTIANDDSTVTVSVAPAATAEDGATNLVYTFTRTGPSTSALTLNFSVSGTATLAGSDYAQTGAATYSDTAGTLIIPATASTATVTINPTADVTSEADETVILTLAANGAPAATGGYTVGSPSAATGTLNDDDLPQVSIVATTPTAVEGGATGLYTFTRNQTAGAQVVNFQLDAGSTATAGSDFTLSGATSFNTGTGAGTITFADTVGTATVTLTALAETPNPAEAAETARLNVVAGSGYVAGSPANATVTIAQNGTLVTAITDSGTGSLRQAVLNANANPGADAITFDPTAFATAQTIVVSALPPTFAMLVLTGDTTITGPAAGVTVEAAVNSGELFTVGAGATVSFTGLTMAGDADSNAPSTVNNGTLTVTNCRFTSTIGSGSFASGIGNNHIATVTGCTFGSAGVLQFGIAFSNTGSLTVSDSLILNCHQGVINGGTATLSGCTIDNEVRVDYGSMRNYSGALTLTNCSIMDRSGYDGLFFVDDGTLLFQNCTLIENSPATGSTNAGTVTMKNTIYRRHPASAAFTDGGGNLLLNRTGTTAPALAADLTTLGLDPTGLQNNGGPTKTIRLLGGSAINGGLPANVPADTLDLDGDSNTTEPIPFDQRGATFLRSIGTVDIGAFELQKSVSIGNLAAISEGNSGTTNFVFTISRTGDTSGSVAMTYTVSGAAVNAADFGGTLPTGTATIPDGSATTTVTIPVSGDTTVEPNEAFTVTLSAPDNGYVVTGAPATSTINNDDTATVTLAKVTDGIEAAAPTAGKFRVTQTAASSVDTVVAYSVTGTATSGTDFTALSGSVTIPAGQTTADIDVTVLNEGTTLEPTETVIATLSGVTTTNSVTLGSTLAATVNIADDDTATVTLAKITDGAETPTSALFRVMQTAAATVDTVITYTTGGTASGTDFTAPSGSVTITAGNTTADITVTITNDALVEATETLSLTLTGFTARDADVSLGTTLTATADIADNDTATVTIAKITDGAEPSTNGLFRVTQTAQSSTNTVLTYAVTGTATSGTDFTALSGSVTILAGNTTADISVPVINETLVEGTETVIATLNGFTARDPEVTLGATVAATVDITDNDTATVTLAKITDGVEAAVPTNALFRVTQTAEASTDTVVSYTVGGTATSGTDFTALSGSVTILAGQTTADITVSVLNDAVVEATETVSLTLTGFTARDPEVTLGATLTASADITDSDTATVTLAKITDGAETPTSALFRVTQNAAASVDTVITYTTGGTASGTDFTAPSGTVTIPAGLTTADISITIVNDTLVEATETLSLTLTGFTARDPDVSLGATVLATAVIDDNDSATVSIAKINDGAEPGTNGLFRITQTAQSSTDTTVAYTVTGTATSGSDFATLSGSVTILAGQTTADITVAVANDFIIEATETVVVSLNTLNADPQIVLGATLAATVNITDNDVAFSIAVNSGSGQSATVNTAFASPLVAVVRDSGGVALQGASVTFAAPGSGASGAFGSSATVLTNSAGLATAPAFTANTISGSYNVTASIPGVVPTASFSLTNTAGAATNYLVSAPGSAIAGVPVDVRVTARDAFNNIATAYPGTVRLTSSDGAAILPANNTLTSGTRTFSVNFSTGGNQTVTATDTVSSGITGTSGNVAVSPRADLAVTLTDSPDPVNALGNLTYTITLTNNGPSASVSPSISLPLPSSTTFVSATGTAGWTPSTPTVGTNGTVTFSNATLAWGSSATFTVVAKVDLNVVNNTILTATTTASQTTTDPDGGNNSATANTTARSGADLVATLTAAPEPVIAGTDLTYSLRVKNNGPLAADNAALSFTLPSGTTFVSLGSNSGWTGTTPAFGATGAVSITNSLFANAGDVSFPLVVKVGSDVVTGSVLNATLNSSSTTIDVAPGNESSSTASNVITRSDLAIELTSTPDITPKGSDVNYTLTLTNNGPSDAVNPSVSFPIPAQMTFVTAATPLGWTVSTPTIGSGGTVTFTKAGLVTGSVVSFTVVTKVKTTTANGTVITATASASASGTDIVSANDADSTNSAVGTTTPTALQLATASTFNRQNGLFEFTVNVTNTTPLPINGFRLRVNFASYLAAYPSLRLYNATSAPGSSDVYVDYPYPVAVDGVVPVKLSFYTSTRTFPNPFEPVLSVETLPTSAVSNTNGAGVQPRFVQLTDGNVLLEFSSIPGRWYRVRYSHDMVNWFDSPVPIQAANNRMQWIDSGAPFTISPPSSVPSRFYLVNEITVVPAP